MARYLRQSNADVLPDRVYGFAQGAYAEQVTINPMLLCPIPEHISFEQASVVGM